MDNLSPWIHELKKRPVKPTLTENKHTDVAIVGGGIAGVCTAYFTLKNTKKKVILLESDKIAHGATGHNAGQIVSYFERQISDIVREYGLPMGIAAQKAVDSAWILLENIHREARLKTPYALFTGYAGCQDLAEILVHLENNLYCEVGKITKEPLMVAKESGIIQHISPMYNGLYSVVPHAKILSLLETTNPAYIACLSARKGCMNSALFTEELLQYIAKKYPSRFDYFEESHVKDVRLESDRARLQVNSHEVECTHVVLCTNGFERFTISNVSGVDINTKFHHLVRGSVGYVAAYVEKRTREPVAISYLPKHGTNGDTYDADPYFYMSRRTFEMEGNKKDSLICMAGPEALMDDTNNYSKEHPYPDEAQKKLDMFLHTSYKYAPEATITYKYKWHGLMGYTPNGLRCIGPEPINPVLFYNLGCNGVGILPSIYGGLKISQYLKGDRMEPSIFDPQDSRRLTVDSSKKHTQSLFKKIWDRLAGSPKQ